MDVLNLIDEIEDIIEAGTSLPFSGKKMVDALDLLEIIKDVRIRLPDEIKQASWIKEERQRILEEAQRDADEIIKDGGEKVEKMVSNENINI